MNDLNNLRNRLGLGGSRTEIKTTIINDMRIKATGEFKLIEAKYAKLAAEYFAGHKTIFINNSSGPNIGKIEAVKNVKASDIMIERVTSGTVKPKIKL
jgi:ATP phosphoribosyltransferase